ncbi:hypothetical protein niasHT_026541 [Heterodera trifolii]|uniref:VWFA domain-containing protein n=1 Tax=Heterodera trifolii TaxID=157864 RepID=A0ABD2KS43_9BILA
MLKKQPNAPRGAVQMFCKRLFCLMPARKIKWTSNSRKTEDIERFSTGRKRFYELIVFHRTPMERLQSANIDQITEQISTLSMVNSQETSPAKALNEARTVVEKMPQAQSVILLAHDGHNTDLASETLTASARLSKKVPIFAIAGGKTPPALAKLDEYTGGQRQRVFAFEQDGQQFLDALDEEIEFCPSPSSVPAEKNAAEPSPSVALAAEAEKPTQKSEVKKPMEIIRKQVRNSKDLVKLECGTNSGEVDLVLLLDTSGSIFHTFGNELALVKSLLSKLQNSIGDQSLRVSLISFAEKPTVAFSLNDTLNGTEMLSRVDQVQFSGGVTQICDAIDRGQKEFEKFGRSGALKVFVLISDGHGHELWPKTLETGKNLRQQKLQKFAVSMSGDYSKDELMAYMGEANRIFVGFRQTLFEPTLLAFINECLSHPSSSSNAENNDETPDTVTKEAETTLTTPADTTETKPAETTVAAEPETTVTSEAETTAKNEDETTVTMEAEETTVTKEAEETTVTKEAEETTVTKEPKETAVKKEAEETTVTKEAEATTGTNGAQETTLTKEVEETTVTKEAQETTITKAAEETTVTKEAEETTVTKEAEETTVTKEPDETTITKAAEETTVTKEPDETTITKEAEETTVTKEAEETTVTSTAVQSSENATAEESKAAENSNAPSSGGEIGAVPAEEEQQTTEGSTISAVLTEQTNAAEGATNGQSTNGTIAEAETETTASTAAPPTEQTTLINAPTETNEQTNGTNAAKATNSAPLANQTNAEQTKGDANQTMVDKAPDGTNATSAGQQMAREKTENATNSTSAAVQHNSDQTKGNADQLTQPSKEDSANSTATDQQATPKNSSDGIAANTTNPAQNTDQKTAPGTTQNSENPTNQSASPDAEKANVNQIIPKKSDGNATFTPANQTTTTDQDNANLSISAQNAKLNNVGPTPEKSGNNTNSNPTQNAVDMGNATQDTSSEKSNGNMNMTNADPQKSNAKQTDQKPNANQMAATAKAEKSVANATTVDQKTAPTTAENSSAATANSAPNNASNNGTSVSGAPAEMQNVDDETKLKMMIMSSLASQTAPHSAPNPSAAEQRQGAPKGAGVTNNSTAPQSAEKKPSLPAAELANERPQKA